MTRHRVALAVVVLSTILSRAQQLSLHSTFQAKTIHSPEGADTYVRWGREWASGRPRTWVC